MIINIKSGREMAKYFQIDGNVARAAIARGDYMDFLLVVKEVSNRKIIYVFDSNTHELIDVFNGVALKYAKVKFYTLNSLIESGTPYQGKIYSYKDKL